MEWGRGKRWREEGGREGGRDLLGASHSSIFRDIDIERGHYLLTSRTILLMQYTDS